MNIQNVISINFLTIIEFMFLQVRRYNQSILLSDQSTKEYRNINFAQLSADNVDHNIATLTGHGTFHGMGIIETVTPGEIKPDAIRRLKDRKLINEVINNCGKVPIVQYTLGPNKTHEASSNLTEF